MSLVKPNKKLIIITNPSAGSGKKKRLFKKIIDKLLAISINIEIFESKNSNHAEEIAYKYASIGNTIVACGGDGHVNNLAPIAAKSHVKFGIIPIGSGNDFASSLGLNNFDNIISALIGNRIKVIDLWKLNNRVFCSVANIGFSSKANEWANKRKLLSGSFLYFSSVITTIFNFKPVSLKIKIVPMIVAKDRIDSLLDCKFSTYNLKFGANSVIKAGKKKSIIPPIAIIPK